MAEILVIQLLLEVTCSHLFPRGLSSRQARDSVTACSPSARSGWALGAHTSSNSTIPGGGVAMGDTGT